MHKAFPKRQILDSSKLKEFADDNSKFDENGRKLSRWVENTEGKEKLLVTSNFSFSYSVFKRYTLQKRENPGLVLERVMSLFHRALLVLFFTKRASVNLHRPQSIIQSVGRWVGSLYTKLIRILKRAYCLF